MTSSTYKTRRGELETYFDRTAADAWARLTSDTPVSRIRETVRAGRDSMRNTILSWLPADMSGARLLDAGCGTGALAVEAARRGAHVVAIDLSPTLVKLAADRSSSLQLSGKLEFKVGDMSDTTLGTFDHVVAMDSLIHYRAADMVAALSRLSGMARSSVIFTFAPQTPVLALMHVVGRVFPRGDRAPAIEPVSKRRLESLIDSAPDMKHCTRSRNHRISTAFYISHAMEISCEYSQRNGG